MKRVVLFLLMCLVLFGGAYAEEQRSPFPNETITITTYYPSPYGVYRELRTTREAIGEMYLKGDEYCWEGNCVYRIPEDVRLIVQGKGGVNTHEPEADFEINNTLRLTPTYSPSYVAEGNIYYNQQEKLVKYYDGEEWKNIGGGVLVDRGKLILPEGRYTSIRVTFEEKFTDYPNVQVYLKEVCQKKKKKCQKSMYKLHCKVEDDDAGDDDDDREGKCKKYPYFKVTNVTKNGFTIVIVHKLKQATEAKWVAVGD